MKTNKITIPIENILGGGTMPIKGISDVNRLNRADKIRLGEKKKNAKGAEYPVQLDYFKVPEVVQAVYGPKPTELDIMFASEDEEQIFPQYRKLYGTTGLKCKGDGENAVIMSKGEYIQKPCTPDDPQCKKCKPIATLNVCLPKVPGFGVWPICTSSWNSIVNINTCLRSIRNMTGGRISLIPLKLRYKPHVGHIVSDGIEMQKEVYVLSIDFDMKLEDFVEKYQIKQEYIPGLTEAAEKMKMLNAAKVEPDEEFEEIPTTDQMKELAVLAKKKGLSLKVDGPALVGREPGEMWSMEDFNRCLAVLEAMEDVTL